jgi:hypothetical protein
MKMYQMLLLLYFLPFFISRYLTIYVYKNRKLFSIIFKHHDENRYLIENEERLAWVIPIFNIVHSILYTIFIVVYWAKTNKNNILVRLWKKLFYLEEKI